MNPSLKSPVPSDLPAWMGYAQTAPLTVRICAWCPSAGEVTRWCRVAGIETTHGICTACYQKMIGTLTNEQ